MGPLYQPDGSKSGIAYSVDHIIDQKHVGSHIRKGQTDLCGCRSPVLAYGYPVWFSLRDERANRNRLIYLLQTVQNKCLRTIIGVYKTTNIQVLEHEASVPPLDLYLEILATNHV
jgi:hypothetical protein